MTSCNKHEQVGVDLFIKNKTKSLLGAIINVFCYASAKLLAKPVCKDVQGIRSVQNVQDVQYSKYVQSVLSVQYVQNV